MVTYKIVVSDMNIRFGNISEMQKYAYIGNPKEDDDAQIMRFPLEQRVRAAQKIADDIRAQGGKAEVLQHQWIDSVHPVEMGDYKFSIYSYATHSGGQPVPPAVMVFDDVDAGSLLYLKELQKIIEESGVEGVSESIVFPVKLTACNSTPFFFETQKALNTLKNLKIPKPSIIAELMRVVFNNCAISRLDTPREPGNEFVPV